VLTYLQGCGSIRLKTATVTQAEREEQPGVKKVIEDGTTIIIPNKEGKLQKKKALHGTQPAPRPPRGCAREKCREDSSHPTTGVLLPWPGASPVGNSQEQQSKGEQQSKVDSGAPTDCSAHGNKGLEVEILKSQRATQLAI